MAKYGDIIIPQSFEVLTPIVKSDVTVYSPPIQHFFVGVTGDIAVTDAVGNVVTLKGCIAGHVYNFKVSKIMSTNTTATDIVRCEFE